MQRKKKQFYANNERKVYSSELRQSQINTIHSWITNFFNEGASPYY